MVPRNQLEKRENKKIDCFSQDEINNIKVAFKGNKFECFIYTAIYTGMRLGELIALTWDNVDLDNGIIYVKESCKFTAVFNTDGTSEYKKITSDPKTAHGIREIYIPDILINKLKSHPRDNELVFTNYGEIITPKALYTQWVNTLKNNNIPYKKFHALRHTYASTLLANGADLKSVQDLMRSL